jgi:non-ribosomal peptide synthetase component F
MTGSLIVPAACGRELADKTSSMSQDDVLNLLNRTLDNSRASVELAKAILRDAATGLRSIQSHEAYSCAVLIRLIKRLGGDRHAAPAQPPPAREDPRRNRSTCPTPLRHPTTFRVEG